jgi:maltose alpha-D-glucosyltransferase/alpha-amylase
VLAQLPHADREMLLAEVNTDTAESESGRWLLPLTMVWENETTSALPTQLALARVRRRARVGLLTDAFALPSFAQAVLRGMAEGKGAEGEEGGLHFHSTLEGQETLQRASEAEVSVLTAEQSNSSANIGDITVLKMFRRIAPGPNPEAEMTRYLTRAGFANTAPLLGEVEYAAPKGDRYLLGVAQGYVRNQGDAWRWMLDRFKRSVDQLATQQADEEARADDEADYKAVAAAIGTRLGEMHAVLLQPTKDDAFAPKRAGTNDVRAWVRRAEAMLRRALDVIGKRDSWDNVQTATEANLLLSQRREAVAGLRRIAETGKGSLLCRIHGDFHLGQVLVSGSDAYIIDFEGEPSRSLEERRAKDSPLRDVAGLLRSLDYAAAATLASENVIAAPVAEETRTACIANLRHSASQAFLDAYTAALGDRGPQPESPLLSLFLIEKAAYEVGYEAANRPSWLPIPVKGLCSLLNDPALSKTAP